MIMHKKQKKVKTLFANPQPALPSIFACLERMVVLKDMYVHLRARDKRTDRLEYADGQVFADLPIESSKNRRLYLFMYYQYIRLKKAAKKVIFF